MSKLVKFGIAAAAVVTLVAAAALLPLRHWTLSLVEWVHTLGPMGVVAYAFVYIAATVTLFPASLLTLAAGFLYGPIWGTLLVSPVSVLASTLAFLLGRSVARERIKHRI